MTCCFTHTKGKFRKYYSVEGLFSKIFLRVQLLCNEHSIFGKIIRKTYYSKYKGPSRKYIAIALKMDISAPTKRVFEFPPTNIVI